MATISKWPSRDSTTLKHWRPMEPVAPRIAILREGRETGSVISPGFAWLRVVAIKYEITLKEQE